jgi:Ring finger domain
MNNDRPNNRFLPHAVQNFFWGRSRRRHGQQQQHESEQERYTQIQGNIHLAHFSHQTTSCDNVVDREMTPVEELDALEHRSTPALQPVREDEDVADSRSVNSMPDLQSVSDSDSDSQDARDVEMHVVEDDHSHDWTDDESNHPPLETVPPVERSHRRVQVEDVEEEPRVTHAQDTTPPVPPIVNDAPHRPNLPPWAFAPGAPRPQFQPDFHHLFPSFSQRGPRTSPTSQPNPRHEDDPISPPGPGRHHVHAHAYVLAMDSNGRPVTIQMGLPSGGGPTTPLQGTPMFDFVMGGGPTGGSGLNGSPLPGDMPTWADVMQMFGREPDEREDPERAKKLVAGLEEVPVGLVKRMIRVGGAPGGHVDDAQTQSSEIPGCAVCWDSLLNEDDESTDPPQEQPKIVCLPCSHVFHSSCLIPWFSKPRHTTCPTCRFNIDPENLTYTPRQPQPRQPDTPSDRPPSEPVQQEQPNRPAMEHSWLPPRSDARTEPGQPQPQAERTQQFPFTGFRSTVPDNAMPSATSRPNFNFGSPPHTFHHGRTQGSGFTVDFTWQIPNNADQDDERLAEDLQNQASAFVQQFLGGMGGASIFGGMPMPPMGSRHSNFFGRSTSTPAGPPQPRKEWSPPPAPGPTLRQRIECKEREAGLRCDDISCGIGPSDEDPHPSHFDHQSVIRQISISHESDRSSNVCSHKFHPSCLVSADRCSGWGDDIEHEKTPFETVSCPMCRAIGSVSRDVWDEGAQILMA